jgi:galactonate dehydratase
MSESSPLPSRIPPPNTRGSRRDFLASAGIAAAGMCMAREALGADNPAEQVADRAASIKIKSLKAVPVKGNLYIKIDTNEGVFGWGETAGVEPRVAAELARSLFELLNGENPTRIEYLWQKLYRSHRDIRGGPFMVHVISAIDMALWDIAGKLHGVPVYRLLGGPVRNKIRYYSHAKAHKAPPGGVFEHSGNPPDIEKMVNMVKSAREKVGPDGTVMFDAHCAVPPATLIQFASAIKAYDVLFIEEVAVPGNIEVFKRLKAAISIPLAAGERDRTIWEFIPYLQEKCLDILQPDVSHSGGITQMIKIATLAEAYLTPLAPHCTNTLLGISASLHAIAAVPLFLIHECYFFNHAEKDAIRVPFTVDKDGYIGLPPGPGLGVEIDEKALDELSNDPAFRWKWPVYGRLKDGSIADY